MWRRAKNDTDCVNTTQFGKWSVESNAHMNTTTIHNFDESTKRVKNKCGCEFLVRHHRRVVRTTKCIGMNFLPALKFLSSVLGIWGGGGVSRAGWLVVGYDCDDNNGNYQQRQQPLKPVGLAASTRVCVGFCDLLSHFRTGELVYVCAGQCRILLSGAGWSYKTEAFGMDRLCLVGINCLLSWDFQTHALAC